MPPKPKEQVKGSGAEWYNIDFDPEILKRGAVVATAKVIKGQCYVQMPRNINCEIIISNVYVGAYTRQKERRMKMMRSRKSSYGASREEDEAAQKVLKVSCGICDVYHCYFIF